MFTAIHNGQQPLVVASVGGTAVGSELLELCAAAHPIASRLVPGLHMVLVCGPGLRPESLQVAEAVEVKGYVPDLHRHVAACGLAIVQGGGTTTLELTALRRPFLYFPLEQHFEQRFLVPQRLERLGAGVRMLSSQTTSEALAQAIAANIGKDVSYPPIASDGARRAAALIDGLLKD
jgi:predicted glycosyltransferase